MHAETAAWLGLAAKINRSVSSHVYHTRRDRLRDSEVRMRAETSCIERDFKFSHGEGRRGCVMYVTVSHG